MRKLAPWPVDWLDPAEAVARRALQQLTLSGAHADKVNNRADIAVMSSGKTTGAKERVLNSFGLTGRDLQATNKLKLIAPITTTG